MKADGAKNSGLKNRTRLAANWLSPRDYQLPLEPAPFIVSVLAAPRGETYVESSLDTNQNIRLPWNMARILYRTGIAYKYRVLWEFEWDWRAVNFGLANLAGLESKLDYLAAMGVKTIFASGTPWINAI